MIDLFEHNQAAYDAVVCQLAETGKACVIHPTGTGKSFIAFKWLEEYPDRQFVWLSPSENIFKTQLENVHIACGFVPQNVRFITYAKLMNMPEAEMDALRFDGLVLDEMHRAGAAMWGKGVRALIAGHPDAQLLGLTATPVRYLDEQRDMAAELFDNCIADSMSLGEAIRRGILPAPKYVTALYTYTLDLKRYANRISRTNAATRRKAENILNRLRRALDTAEGLDAIFTKYLTKGKYIAFCANTAHMKRMETECRRWFSGIDSDAHIYTVWADSPTAESDYAAFKQDDSNHLRVLFSIDMFNEGIHVEDLDGVLLFRATISPIIYKQQIGRALSTMKSSVPLIIDVVNNFENLYSIRALEREMAEAVTHYRGHIEQEDWAMSSFLIIDEVRECRRLFEQLEETLSLSWDEMYAVAKKYYETHGDLKVEKRYRTEEGIPLGSWVATQRAVYRGDRDGLMDEERVRRLDRIGMVWDDPRQTRWEVGYRHAVQYHAAKGDLDVPVGFASDDGYALGRWIAAQRRAYRAMRAAGEDPGKVERFARLGRLGMVWDTHDALFDEGLREARAYYSAHGDLNVPAQYVSTSGYNLGAWIIRMRRRYTGVGNGLPLTEEQIKSLERIGMEWRDKYESKWDENFDIAQRYFDQHGDMRVPKGFEMGGLRLDKWVQRQRRANREQKLRPGQREKLQKLGIVAAQ